MTKLSKLSKCLNLFYVKEFQLVINSQNRHLDNLDTQKTNTINGGNYTAKGEIAKG